MRKYNIIKNTIRKCLAEKKLLYFKLFNHKTVKKYSRNTSRMHRFKKR